MVKGAEWNPPKHSGIKERILSEYLTVWFTALSKSYRAVFYIDGFAGPGIFSNGMVGSPIIALERAFEAWEKREGKQDFLLVFSEKDEATLKELSRNLGRCYKKLYAGCKQQILMRKNLRFWVGGSSFQDLVNEIEEAVSFDKWRAPLFAFIDPYGCDIPFSCVLKLLKPQKSELMITFMAQGLLRSRNSIKPETLERIFGERLSNSELTYPGVMEKYKQKIKEETNCFVVSFEIVNSKSSPQYHLLHVTHHKKGVTKIKEIMQKVSNSPFKFSNDPREKWQLTLFQNPIKDFYEKLQQIFGGREVTVSNLFDTFVATDKYSWTEKSIREFLKELEKDGKIQVQPKKVNGKKRKRGTFPGEVIIFVP